MQTPEGDAPAGNAPFIQTGVAALALLLWTGLVIWLGTQVLREIDAFSKSNSDNLQWSLAQADVEFLQMQIAMDSALQDPERLEDLRLRFDVFFSRMTTLENGKLFQPLYTSPAFAVPKARVHDFLDETVGVMDGPDAALVAALPALHGRMHEVVREVRAFSLAALTIFADLSDTRRASLSRLMFHMAGVLAVLFIGLIFLSAALFRLFRLARNRADEIEIASARLRTIVETSPNAIVVTDASGRIQVFNAAAERLFGYDRAEVGGKLARRLFVPAPELDSQGRAAFSFVRERRRPRPDERNFEIVLQARGGRRFPADFSVDRAGASNPLYVAYIRDISQWRDAEAQLTEARDRALAGERSKSRFLAVMSHEMRTPLNGLLGAIQLFRERDLTERQGDLLDRMQQSGRLLLDLVNDVLDLAKLESGKMVAETAPFSLPGLLDGVVQTTAPLAERANTRLTWAWVGPPRELVQGDARRLRHVLLNLVSNAVKFTRDGRIDIEVERIGGENGAIEFRVLDTGIGIAEADIDRIFADFETLDSSYARETAGTGLGLGIAQRFTRLMGGSIGVESEPGEGSLFWVRLPLPCAQRPAALADPAPGGSAALPGPLEILVVEDNEINQFILCQMLGTEGHRITLADNGQAGVARAAECRFDIILMDISMPEMDGATAARLIRGGDGASARSPIVALTAHAFPEERAQFEEAGMFACLTKPIDKSLLLPTIADALHQTRADTGRADPAALDAALVDQLLADLPGVAAGPLLSRFRDETGREIARISRLDPADPDLLASVHRCAGSCGTFGLVALRDALREIEAGIKRAASPDRATLSALPDLWRQGDTALSDHLERRAAA